MDATNVVLHPTNSPLLSLLYQRADECFYMTQMMGMLNMGSRTIQKGLKDLTRAGLIKKVKREGYTFYQANKDYEFFPVTQSLVTQMAGKTYPAAIRSALKPLRSKIRTAFIFGSAARNEIKTGSDIDVMIVGNVTHDEVCPRVKKYEETFHREISPVIFSPEDFRKTFRKGNHFLNTVFAGNKIMLIGDSDDLTNLGR